MSVLLPNPKEIEREEDKVIAQRFIESLEKELSVKDKDEVIEIIKKRVKDLVNEHPYLVGIIIGLLIAKYADIAKKI